jgi:hypothetical protein
MEDNNKFMGQLSFYCTGDGVDCFHSVKVTTKEEATRIVSILSRYVTFLADNIVSTKINMYEDYVDKEVG